MRVAGKSDTGRSRSANEDSLLIDERIGLLAVADGMGGHAGGSVASHLAVGALGAYLTQGLDNGLANADPEALLKRAFGAADQSIVQKAKEDDSLKEMASTLVAALVNGTSVHLAHLGDSRAYLIRPEQGIGRLTEDHSLVQEMVNEGRITESAAKNHRLRNVVTHCLGGGRFEEPEVSKLDLCPGATLLLCSDGLTTMVEDEDILRIVRRSGSDVKAACGRLVDLANKRGGKDNVSVILALYE